VAQPDGLASRQSRSGHRQPGRSRGLGWRRGVSRPGRAPSDADRRRGTGPVALSPH